MSSDTPQSSPSLLTYLRQYRFQRKPNASENSSPSNGQAIQTASTMQSSPSINLPPGITYKRIRVMHDSSESDSNSPPHKKPQTEPSPGVTAVQLTPAIKERRFKNMSEMFPEITAMMIKNTLIKHNWNEERCRDELIDFDPECEEKMVYVKLPTSSGYKGNTNNRPAIHYYNQNGRTAGTSSTTKVITVVASPMPMKKKSSGNRGSRRRKGSEDSDDSDYASRKGRDDKVYDSSDEDSDAEIDTNLIGEKKNVYEFLNNSKLNELMRLSGCSAKKADVIMALRPFNGWLDMVQKFQDSKFLNTDILNSTQELLSIRNNVQKLMKKCLGLASQLEAAVAAGGGVQSQPNILSPSLKLAPYQLIGLNWLIVLHQQGVSGILADEMGLGKTVQVIAFLAYLKETGKAKGPHLVVVPASTLDNWSNEFARWCPSMNVSMYYGPQDERRMMRIKYVKGGFQDLDVILTTYSMLGSLPEERKMFRVMPLDYVTFDEAHMLKNMATQRYENLIKIKSRHRILLTGTPLQNNLLELMSLLCFVMPHMFEGNTDDLKSLFQKNSKNTTKKKKDENKDQEDIPLFEQSQISQAKRIMKPFLLRRLKRDVLKDLPKKIDYVLKVPMVQSQQQRYTDLIKSFSTNDGVVHANTEQSGMSMMMDMRKLANHPLLMRYYYDEDKLRELALRLAQDSFYKDTNSDYIFQDLLFMSDFHIHQMTSTYKSIVGMKLPNSQILESGKFAKLDEMLPRLQLEGHRVLIFSQFTIMLDILEPYLRLRNHRYLRLDGSTAVTERQNLIDEFNEDESILVFLLSTKAGGLGINLTAADTVIIHDIDFNPYNDKQAEDRCHRMGQKRPVTIYRLLSIGTIEEGIFQVAQEKLSLERDMTKTDENETQESKNVVRLLTLALGLTSPNK